MTDSTPNPRMLDERSVSKDLALASVLFHRINRIVPPHQQLLTIEPWRTAREAVQLMLEHGYSQVPVVAAGGEILGVFSYRSFVKNTASMTLGDVNQQKCAPGDLRVDEFLEQFDYARVTEEFGRVLDALDRDGGVLIGSPDRPSGILTPMDLLRYLYQVASPFVLVSEIELAVRALIRSAMTGSQIEEGARRSLASVYRSVDAVPTALEEMTFDNYRVFVMHADNWKHVERVFGGTRTRTGGKLKEVGEIRNALFHFKREISVRDHEVLADHRNWLLTKIKQAEASHPAEVNR